VNKVKKSINAPKKEKVGTYLYAMHHKVQEIKEKMQANGRRHPFVKAEKDQKI
jgi:hypothetical protein